MYLFSNKQQENNKNIANLKKKLKTCLKVELKTKKIMFYFYLFSNAHYKIDAEKRDMNVM